MPRRPEPGTPTPRRRPPHAVTDTRGGQPRVSHLLAAIRYLSAVKLQRAVRRSGLLDRGFVLL